jgi:hypothetical protein
LGITLFEEIIETAGRVEPATEMDGGPENAVVRQL